jgi:hypothetical protein
MCENGRLLDGRAELRRKGTYFSRPGAIRVTESEAGLATKYFRKGTDGASVLGVVVTCRRISQTRSFRHELLIQY